MTNIDNLKLNGIIFALFLISLDAYSFGNIPIQWMGLAVLLFLFILMNNFSIADDKISSTPLINLDKIKPSFESPDDVKDNVSSNQNIREKGSQIMNGSISLKKGNKLNPSRKCSICTCCYNK